MGFSYEVRRNGEAENRDLVFVNSGPLFDDWEEGLEKAEYGRLWEDGENSEFTVYFWIEWLRYIVKEFGGGVGYGGGRRGRG